VDEKLCKEEREELVQLFKDIPGWKQRIAGKSIPMEKFAVKKCERFFTQGNKLILPAVELLYLWNGFKVLGKQMDLVQPLLVLIEKNIMCLGKEKDGPYYVDNLCLLFLLKGMCFRYMGRYHDSDSAFREVISYEKKVVEDNYLVPYATYELAISYWAQGNVERAASTLENAKNSYKGYALESRLHFRIHSALADLRVTKGTKFNHESMSTPKHNHVNHNSSAPSSPSLL